MENEKHMEIGSRKSIGLAILLDLAFKPLDKWKKMTVNGTFKTWTYIWYNATVYESSLKVIDHRSTPFSIII